MINERTADVTAKIREMCEGKGTWLYWSDYGSHLYGTNSEHSDRDYRGVFLPYKYSMLMGKVCDEINYTSGDANEKNTADDIDIKLFSLQKFIKLCVAGDTNALDLLFSYPATHVSSVSNSPAVKELYESRHKLINLTTMKAFIGYAISQAKKYGIRGSRMGVLKSLNEYLTYTPGTVAFNREAKLGMIADQILEKFQDDSYMFHKNEKGNDYLVICGTMHQYDISIQEFTNRISKAFQSYGERTRMAEENQGIDWKALSHAVRCLEQCKELLNTGNITFPLTSRHLIKSIKQGEVEYKVVEALILLGLEEVEKLQQEASSAYKYREDFARELIMRHYGECSD